MTTDDRDWNINKGFGDILTGLIDEINLAAKAGDIVQWFNGLRILYRNVSGHKKVDKKAMEKVDTDMKALKPKFANVQKTAMTEVGKASQQGFKNDVKDKLDEINITLITEMHKAGLIFPTFKRRSDLSGLET